MWARHMFSSLHSFVAVSPNPTSEDISGLLDAAFVHFEASETAERLILSCALSYLLTFFTGKICVQNMLSTFNSSESVIISC